MEFEELIHSKYSEPAAILKYSDGMLTVSDINEAFISELWMNVSKEEFIGPNLGKMFDEADLKFFTSAVKKKPGGIFLQTAADLTKCVLRAD